MTNKTVTMSWELAQFALNAVEYLALRGDDIDTSNASVADELRALLAVDTCITCSGNGAVGNILNAEPCPDCATPVVERQPDAIIEGVMTSVGITHVIYASTVSLKHGERVKLYTKPTEPSAVVDLIEAVQELLAGTGTSPGANKRYGKIRACLDKVKELNR